MLKLISIKKSTQPEKKYTATFLKDGRTLTTHFGSAGMTDYILSQDPDRRRNYLQRHRANENWNDPTSAGSLSRYILWGDSTSIQENIKSFKRRFAL